jgi:cation/acetate symporter
MGVDATTGATSARHLIQAKPLFPLDNPGIVSIPLEMLGAWVGTLLGGPASAEDKWLELEVRANTGLGSEKAATN